MHTNPVLRVTTRRRMRQLSHRARSTSEPLTPAEITRFLAAVPAWYRDLYAVWFHPPRAGH